MRLVPVNKQKSIRCPDGFTLVELLVVMAVFMTVLIIAAQTLNTVITQSSRFSKSEESNIEGVIGLEVMRHDLEQVGFGLPWGFISSSDPEIDYKEAVDAKGAVMNDAPSGVPRAFAAVDAFGNFSSDYIAVKGTTVSHSKAAQRWTYIPYHNYSAASGWTSRPVAYPANNLNTSDRVTVIRSNFNDPDDDHRLIVAPGDNEAFFINFNATGLISDDFLPQNDKHTHLVYGVNESNPRMPFNRADFFVKVPGGGSEGTLPPFCAPRTGVLYKVTVKHADGNYNYIPLLDCVADMQVVLGWDTSDGGKANTVDTYTSLPDSTTGTITASPADAAADIQGWLLDAKGIREHLKVIKVYILAQEGRVDRNYTSPVTSYLVGPVGQGSLSRNYTLSSDQSHYRWKLYRLIVRPKNLVSNQQ